MGSTYERKAKVNIKIYDPRITKAPFEFITLESFEGDIPESIKGTEIAAYFRKETMKRGYDFRFWSIDTVDGKTEYDITVENAGSPGSNGYFTKHWPKDEKIQTKKFVYFESTEGGMTPHVFSSIKEFNCSGWLSSSYVDNDMALVFWSTKAEIGDCFHHRLGVCVRVNLETTLIN